MRRLLLRAVRVLAPVFGVALAVIALGRVVEPVRVAGLSMHPALHVGDLALVLRGQRAREGDIVLVDLPGGLRALHRVIDSGPRGIRTRGDANGAIDRDARSPSQIEGRVVAVIPFGRLLERSRLVPVYATLPTQPNSRR